MDIYYVDCENVGLRHITQTFSDDFLVLYFTSKNLRIKDLKENEKEFVCSLDRRKDALDYIIDTYLGYSIAQYPVDTKHHIVSNDTGFDNVVQFWINKGYNLTRSCLHNYDDTETDASTQDLEFMLRRLTNRNRFKLFDTYKRWDNSCEETEILDRKIRSLKLVSEYTEEELEKLIQLLTIMDSGLVLHILEV